MAHFKDANVIIGEFQKLIDATPPEAAHIRIQTDAWTLTEIIGHMVDSASNNHQRFARLQHGDLDSFPAYDAEPWVAAQPYDGMDFETLAALWTSYNRFLLHLAEQTPAKLLTNAWLHEGKSMSLGFLIDDYYRHIQMHVDHYRKRLAEALQAMAG